MCKGGESTHTKTGLWYRLVTADVIGLSLTWNLTHTHTLTHRHTQQGCGHHTASFLALALMPDCLTNCGKWIMPVFAGCGVRPQFGGRPTIWIQQPSAARHAESTCLRARMRWFAMVGGSYVCVRVCVCVRESMCV